MHFWYFNVKRIIPIAVIVLIWVIYFWRQIAGGDVWYCCDNLLINVPSKVFLVRELSRGKFPITNPYLFSGTPFWADINLSILHPNTILYFFFSPFRAVTIGILLSYPVAMLGMYALGRVLRFNRFAALLGAIVFGLSGTLMVYANNIPILQVAVLAPWILAAWIRYLEIPTIKRLAWLAAVAWFQIFSGHPQLVYYTWLVLIAYTVLEKPGMQSFLLGLRVILLVALATSIQTIPFVAFLSASTRVSQDFVSATTSSVHPLSLTRIVLPGIVGNLSEGTAWVSAGSMHGFVGFIALLLIPAAWKSGVTGKFFLAIAVWSLIMAMGSYTPVYRLAYFLIPGIALFREPGQFLFLFTLGIAVSAMAGAQAFMSKPASVRYFLCIGVASWLSAGIMASYQQNLRLEIASTRVLPSRLLTKLAALSDSQWRVATKGLKDNLLLLGLSGVLAGLAFSRVRKSNPARILILAMLFGELWVYGKTNVTTIAESTVTRWLDEAGKRVESWGLSGQSGYRYYTDPLVYPYPDKKPLGQWNDPGESEWQFVILRPSIGMLYGIPALDGYASMVASSYQKKFGVASRDPTGVTVPSVVHPYVAESGVRTIISKRNNPLLSDSSRYRMISVYGQMAVYQDAIARPVTFSKESE